MSEPVEILRYARDVVLADESAWCQFALSLPGGRATGADDHAFCALGAVRRAAWERGEMPQYQYAAGFLHEAVGGDIADFNNADDRTYSDVLDAFDRAIKKAEEDQ